MQNMPVSESPESPNADLIAALAQVSAQPLWDRYQRVTTRQPVSKAQAMCWPWSVMEPLIERAVREVSMQDAERRVLLLTHPAYADPAGLAVNGGTVATTTNLSAGLQTLMPGEKAHAHRHTLQAIRFVMQGSGAVTTVNDQSYVMEPGDLVLTPAWTWHEHTHTGTERVVWFDGLDLPLCTHLDAVFLELAGPTRDNVPPPATRSPAFVDNAVALPPDSASQKFRYSAARAKEALQSATPQADGSRWLRYVHPDSGGAVLPTLDCYLQALQAGQATQPMRSTSAAICVVAQGQGESTSGGQRIAWQQHDVFTLPHWQWTSHTASSDAIIFMMTDRELLASLHYLRDEKG